MDLIIPVVVGLMVREGRVLFIRRAGKTFPGLLSLPGGKIDYGETVEQSVLREFREETGIDSSFVRHLATIPEHITEDGKVAKHLIIHLCELGHNGETGPAEFERVWVPLGDLPARKAEITPSDYLMITSIFQPNRPGAYFSSMDKTPDGYVQKEFRRI